MDAICKVSLVSNYCLPLPRMEMTICSQWQWLWLSKRTRTTRSGSWSNLQMTLAGQMSSIWYSLVTDKRYYHACLLTLLECLHVYLFTYLFAEIECLLTYLIARPSTCNRDSIPNCGAQVLCEAHIQQLQS